MAITYHTIPKAYSPSGNPLMYRWSSDQTGQPNFSYIVEVYVNGAKESEERIFPESGAYAHIDIQETVDALISSPALLSSFHSESGTVADIFIKVRENYGTPPVNQLELNSSTTKAFKAEVDKKTYEAIDFDTDWKLQKWLTNNPDNNIEILRDQTFSASMIVGSNQTIYFEFYDENDVSLWSYNVANNYDIWQVTGDSDSLVSVTGITPALLNQAAYFTIQIDASELLRFTYLDDYCYQPKALQWLNQYGAFDSFIFVHNDIQGARIDSKSFSRQFGYWQGNDFVYESDKAGQIDYVKTRTDLGRLISGYITEPLHAWVVELYNSPFYVLYEIGGNSNAINILGSAYELGQDRFNGLIDEDIQYKLANTTNSVRR